MTEDGDTTYMVSVAADPAASDAPPTLLLAGFPADRKLLAWTVARGSGADFTVSTMQSLATSFGGGTGLRTDASLSAVSAPTTGTVWFAYGEDGSASAPGIHVGAVGPSGIILDDAVAQPSTSAVVRHAVLGIDTSGRPGLLYADGAGGIDATLLWNGAWLPDVQVTSLATPVAAWGVSDAWQVDGHDGFAMYADSGSGAGTTFAAVSWY
jgi:hypothetical protein